MSAFICKVGLVHFTKVDGSTTDKMAAELEDLSIAEAKAKLGDKYSRSQCKLVAGGGGISQAAITTLVKPELFAMYNYQLGISPVVEGFDVIQVTVAQYPIKIKGQPDKMTNKATIMVNTGASQTVNEAIVLAGHKPVQVAVAQAATQPVPQADPVI